MNVEIKPKPDPSKMKYYIVSLIILFLFCGAINSQDNEYRFTIIKEVPSTPVKNQSVTSTCWSFSGISFLESELLRIGKKPYDLSEMFIVREAYIRKAEEYAKRNGECAFTPGGQYFDFLNMCREYGLEPESVYPGLNYGTKNHNHDELDAVLKGYMNGVLKSTSHTSAWENGLKGILDAYLGATSQGFEYEGKYYTPKTFAQELGLNFNDYIVMSSFNDHPFYKESVLEVPDNWAPCTYYNLPIDELISVIDNAIMNGYSVAWAADMKGKGFSMRNGVAIVPEEEWSKLSDKDIKELFSGPHRQKKITQNIRQNEFGDNAITGDHGMHIVGIARDQKGNIFYKVKNSWGPTGKYNGYIYVSKEYVMLKTTDCMINKNALPVATAGRLGISVDNWHESPMADSRVKNESPVTVSQGQTKSENIPAAAGR